MTVKKAMEDARIYLDNKWKEKYPDGELRIFTSKHNGNVYAERHLRRPTSWTLCLRQVRQHLIMNGKTSGEESYRHLPLAKNKLKNKKYSNKEKFINELKKLNFDEKCIDYLFR